ncbi:MAG TPA: polysaccharide biosynthesis C-terminal domain-containing protein, partial [Tepidisphaeraceae bacterium]|nr:polysaccharide biosynthesis C-terminal domain-containing protein [Tepidisphaeraceae bacterium]
LYHGKYIEYAGLLRLLGASLVATSLIDIIGAALRSREQPREVFFAFAASALFGSLAGTAMIYAWGIRGAVAAIVAGSFVAAAVLCAFYWRKDKPRVRPYKSVS